MTQKMELIKHLVNNRANGVDHYEMWEENPCDTEFAVIHKDRPTKGDGLFHICEVSLIVDDQHYDLLERIVEAISVTPEGDA